MNKAVFKNRNNEFFKELNKEVESFFNNTNSSSKGDYIIYLKTTLFFLVLIYAYVQLVFFTPESILIKIGLCILLGMQTAFIGFNVMHDALHGSYAQNEKVNRVMGYSMNLLGASSFIWKTKHNVAHHTFTNIEGIDADMDQSIFLRLTPNQKKLWFHKFQHIYFFFLYAFSYVSWIFISDFERYFNRSVKSMSIPKFSVKQHIIFWTSKLAYLFIFIVLPIYFVGLFPTLIGYGIMCGVCGMLLGLVFQLAHVVEKTEIEDATKETVELECEWAIHQLKTTANFATKNRLFSWFLGGLNFQVEHHLFPKISHVHYHKIQPIVERIAKKYNVVYHSYPTFIEALISHSKALRYLGTV